MLDIRNTPVTASPEALEGFEAALLDFQTYTGNPIGKIEETLEQQPAFVLGHLFRAVNYYLASERRFLPPAEEALGAETSYRRGVAFYTGREDVPDVHPHDVLTKFLKRKDRVWCVLKDKNHIQLYTNEKLPYDNPTYLVYKFGKKVIVTNKVPRGLKFLKLRSVNDPY